MANKEQVLIFKCPHCGGLIDISQNETNCRIFRHGVLKDTFKQINPHANKYECDKYLLNNTIYGCGKPFILKQCSKEGYHFIIEKCGYI